MYRRPNRLIIPQYQAPQDLSLIAAAELLGDGKRAAAAQVIDLVVRKVLAIARDGKGFRLTLLRDPGDEGIDQQEFVTQLFGGGRLRPNLSTLRLQRGRNTQLGQRLRGTQRSAIA